MTHNHAAGNSGKIYLTDRFSISIYKTPNAPHSINFWPADPADIPSTVISVISQSDTAFAVSADLGFPVSAQTPSIKLTADDTLFIVQAVNHQPSKNIATNERTTLNYLQMQILR